MIPGAAFAPHRLRARSLPVLHPVIRLGALFLGLATCLVAPSLLLGLMLLFLFYLLAVTGLDPVGQLRALKPWLPMALIIMVIHTFTTTAAAPLGTPSVAGVAAGLKSLLRVGCTVGWLALYTRTSSLDDLVGGVRWWLRPMEKLGFPGENLGLILAIALGTAPVVLGEGRRIETVVRLRRTGPATGTSGHSGSWLSRQLGRQLDRARVVVPLLESLGRRAEALSLSLRARRPGADSTLQRRPTTAGLAFLGLWLALLVVSATGRGGIR
jgi:energy-coupling factor transporter transmembrane protein EcfT